MSSKRSRAKFEAELAAEQSPYVLFGTPLPPLDSDVRDNGSYVPVWKQEVRDEKGRRRLHGAFTGGWSAGYFNTVGSKEGWTPSTFVSSRTNRRKDDPKNVQQRVEDLMDEEDLRDAEDTKMIETNAAFAGLGSTADDVLQASGQMGLLRVKGETIGRKLLQRMGWRDGQGIGPKVRRAARLDLQGAAHGAGETHFFAPENVTMVKYVGKLDRKGLGYAGPARLTPMGAQSKPGRVSTIDDDEEDDEMSNSGRPRTFTTGPSKKIAVKGGIGVGILNDASDEEDPYEIGPRISYNRVLTGDKKIKKAKTSTNPLIQTKPSFMPSKKMALSKVALNLRKCHDGRLPLDGFVLGKDVGSLTSSINDQGKYPPPKIPPDWKSSCQPRTRTGSRSFVSSPDAAKASTLDPKARAAILGEKQLPGKSVFDFMSEDARARLAVATGRPDLPPARNEIPAGFVRSEEEKVQDLLDRVPKLDKETAVAALTRGASGSAPYADDEEKCARYRAYLENQAGFGAALPPKPAKIQNEEWVREFYEFFNCARIFKPMSGLMASRFTTSSTSKLSSGSMRDVHDKDLMAKPPPKPQDPAEEAAKMGIYGPMTRSVTDFYPTKLLCKLLGVKPPAHVEPDQDTATSRARTCEPTSSQSGSFMDYRSSRLDSYTPMPQGEFGDDVVNMDMNIGLKQETELLAEATAPVQDEVVDSGTNKALEGQRAGEEIFKAIFGDSDDDN